MSILSNRHDKGYLTMIRHVRWRMEPATQPNCLWLMLCVTIMMQKDPIRISIGGSYHCSCRIEIKWVMRKRFLDACNTYISHVKFWIVAVLWLPLPTDNSMCFDPKARAASCWPMNWRVLRCSLISGYKSNLYDPLHLRVLRRWLQLGTFPWKVLHIVFALLISCIYMIDCD